MGRKLGKGHALEQIGSTGFWMCYRCRVACLWKSKVTRKFLAKPCRNAEGWD